MLDLCDEPTVYVLVLPCQVYYLNIAGVPTSVMNKRK